MSIVLRVLQIPHETSPFILIGLRCRRNRRRRNAEKKIKLISNFVGFSLFCNFILAFYPVHKHICRRRRRRCPHHFLLSLDRIRRPMYAYNFSFAIYLDHSVSCSLDNNWSLTRRIQCMWEFRTLLDGRLQFTSFTTMFHSCTEPMMLPTCQHCVIAPRIELQKKNIFGLWMSFRTTHNVLS